MTGLRGLMRASALMGVGQLATNLLQIVKLVLTASWFGVTTGKLDVFFVALALPTALQGIVVGTLQAAFIPRYVTLRSKGEHDRAQKFLSACLTLVCLFFGVVSAAMWVWAEPMLSVTLGRAVASLSPTDVLTLRMLVLAFVLSGLSDCLGAFYNANHRFGVPSFGPLLNLAISIVYLIVFRHQGTMALVYGLVAGGAVQFAAMWFLARGFGGFRIRFAAQIRTPDMAGLAGYMLPLSVGFVMINLINIVDNSIVARLGTGAASIYGQAFRLNDVIVKVFVAGLGAALLPYLASAAAARDWVQFQRMFSASCRLAVVLVGPAFVYLYFYGPAMLALVFQRGQFTATDSVVVAHSWALLALALVPTAVTFYAGRALNAIGNKWAIFWCPVLGFVVHSVAKFTLTRWLGLDGMFWGNLVGYIFYTVFYVVALRRCIGSEGGRLGLKSVGQSLVAPVAMILLMAAVGLALGPLLDVRQLTGERGSWLLLAAKLGGTTVFFGIIYAAILFALKYPEFQHLQSAVTSRAASFAQRLRGTAASQ